MRLLIPVLSICASLVSLPGLAQEVSWRELAAHPDRYIGKQVEIRAAYCGNAGDNPGYQCSTDGALYILAKSLGPPRAKQKVDEDCGGMDVIERNASCRAHIRFIPNSYTTSTAYDEGKTVVVINTGDAALSF